MSDLYRTAIHEASHSAAAAAMGCEPGMLSIRRSDAARSLGHAVIDYGAAPAGMTPEDIIGVPYPMMRDDLKRFCERRAVVALAGDRGPVLFSRESGYQPAEHVAEAAALADKLSTSEVERLQAYEQSGTDTTDADTANTAAVIAADGTLRNRWLAFCEAVADQVLIAAQNEIRTLADEAMRNEVVSAQRVQEILGWGDR